MRRAETAHILGRSGRPSARPFRIGEEPTGRSRSRDSGASSCPSLKEAFVIEMVEVIRHPNNLPDLTCPALVCDVYRAVVIESGNIEWRRNLETGEASPLYATHKACSRTLSAALERKYPDTLPQWLDAGSFLEQLGNNYDQSVAEMEGVAEVRMGPRLL